MLRNHSWIWIYTKIWWVLPWAIPHTETNFRHDQSFRVSLLKTSSCGENVNSSVVVIRSRSSWHVYNWLAVWRTASTVVESTFTAAVFQWLWTLWGKCGKATCHCKWRRQSNNRAERAAWMHIVLKSYIAVPGILHLPVTQACNQTTYLSMSKKFHFERSD